MRRKPPFWAVSGASANIWVAAQVHFGSVKRSLRAALVWIKCGNGSDASARDAKTDVSRLGGHFGAWPVQRGRNPCSCPPRSPSAINRKTRIGENRKKNVKRDQPLTSQRLPLQPRTTRLFARAASCAPKHHKNKTKQKKKRTRMAGFEPATANVRKS